MAYAWRNSPKQKSSVVKSFSSTSDTDGTWCKIEFPSFEDNQSNILSLDIRLCSTKIEYADLIGFNNTGNTCIWPSEEVLAFYCLKEKEIFENRSVCELGGGMTCLAGLALARSIPLKEFVATDGNEKSIANLNQILNHTENQKNWLCSIEPKVLIWSRTLNDITLKERFDFIITADCFFFENLHHDLCHTIYYMLKDSGVAINFAPYRSKTLNKFISIAETYPFECRVLEHYDQEVFDKHLQCEQINKHYTSDLHYPILVILRKCSEK
ncbi:unnamed protein product [Adineta ricciae]|uniref:Calmodulin-lysine N-methyltransferase n=1 Tax=Adineta ricciae TaxID=249248 RepID=A0A814H967_ADIRI|nr:unnamed protein product [Adineta ricciae]